MLAGLVLMAREKYIQLEIYSTTRRGVTIADILIERLRLADSQLNRLIR